MTEQDQIKALAELDGWRAIDSYTSIQDGSEVIWWQNGVNEAATRDLPHCLTSYDAIIPLIQKQPQGAFDFNFIAALNCEGKWTPMLEVNMRRLFDFSPAQLCEALLRATGKWKD